MKITAIRDHALSLPEVTEEPHFEKASFRVRGKIFATLPAEEEYLHLFVAAEHRAAALDAHADFIEELMWGKKVAGLRISLAHASSAAVKQLVTQAWRDKAPKALVAKLATLPKKSRPDI
ncbi:MmcQ/YjbR family DNA-binding protein [Luteolibacter sp. Populi]|uniref:MmcQ/YjbR family DNA-binding protein n=1 Tax=Luteolibacter sp. Populi TaxID=3230487 RepID=UPI003467BF53